jgi:hypothetical protein
VVRNQDDRDQKAGGSASGIGGFGRMDLGVLGEAEQGGWRLWSFVVVPLDGATVPWVGVQVRRTCRGEVQMIGGMELVGAGVMMALLEEDLVVVVMGCTPPDQRTEVEVHQDR